MSRAFVLECENLKKTFKETEESELEVLKGINLEVTAGEYISIVGRSGSGKTTLLQMLGGLDLPSSGKIFIQGENLSEITESQRDKVRNQKIGFVYQFHHLLPEFTVLENVAMPLLIANEDVEEIKTRAEQILKKMGLEHRLNYKPAKLSGGERQRVAIARTLINNPVCVLADEPTGNLDSHTSEKVLDIMLSLSHEFNTAFIIVTHDNLLADKMNRKLVLENGILV